MSPVAVSYLGIPGYVIFWVLFAVALGLFAQRIYYLISLLRLGNPENRFDRPVYRFLTMLTKGITQSSNLKTLSFKDPASIGHALMFWGLIIFAVGYVIFLGFGSGFGLFPIINSGGFETVFYSIMDIAGIIIILAMLWVVIKRYIIKPARLERHETTGEKIIQPALITVIILLMAFHFLITGFGYAAYGIPGSWPPIGTAIANALTSGGVSHDALVTGFRTFWWINYIIIVIAMVYAPRSKHLHPIFSFPNIAFRNLANKGALKPVDLQNTDSIKKSSVKDLTWKQMLDFYACTWCGKCHIVCPAQLSGKPLSPRELILVTKEHLLKTGHDLLKAGKSEAATEGEQADAPAAGEKPLVGNVVEEDAIWACTTCRACQEICPSFNEQMNLVVDLRRHQQMIATTEVATETLKNLRVRGNPWRGTMFARTDWAEGLDVKIVGEDDNIDVLYWVGCTEALEDRSLKVAQAVAMLMKQAGVNFGILGEEEMCCGDPARRLGAEHIFQMLAMNNIQILSSYNIKKIVTACPHCFNTLKNEYPQMGAEFEVVHHSQFINDLIRDGKLKLTGTTEALVTYQDPCYLGRYNDIYQQPRDLLNSIPGMTLVEMENNRKDGFCCGGGGGRMWLEENIGTRINEMRMDQASGTKCQIISTACPFCLQMFEDAARAKELSESVRVKDIAEIVAEAAGCDVDLNDKS